MEKGKSSKKNKEPSKRGRKDYWTVLDIPSKLEAVKGWSMHGSTDEDIMKMLGISKDTFYKWKREKEEFAEALKKGKEVSNGEILNSAFKQATGYKTVEEMAFKLKEVEYDPETGKKISEREVIKVMPVIKDVPPNPTMNIFMLKNRMPEEYKDKQIIDSNVNISQKLEDLL